jgi:hypothetical protein
VEKSFIQKPITQNTAPLSVDMRQNEEGGPHLMDLVKPIIETALFVTSLLKRSIQCRNIAHLNATSQLASLENEIFGR